MRQAATPDDGLPLPRRYWAILAISLNTIVVVIDTSIMTVALPTAARDLGVTKSQAISLVAVTQFIALIGLLPLAAVGDRIGHTRLYRAGQAMFIVGSLLCVVAPTLPLLLAARTVQAIGAAAALSVGMALLRATYPGNALGKGLGLNGILISIGSALSPSLGGLVVATLGWRWIFMCPLPMAIGSLLLGRWLPQLTERHPHFDWRGALYYMLSAGMIAAAFSALAYGGHPGLAGPLFLVALIGATLFVRREARVARPILPVDLLARPPIAIAIGAAFTAFMGSITMVLSLPFRLEAILGRHPAEIGGVMMAWPLAMMVSAPIAGALADRLPNGSLGAFGMALSLAGFVLIGTAPGDAGHLELMLRIAPCGLGMGFFISTNSRLLIGASPRGRTASAGGLQSTTRILGQSTGAAMVALLLQPGFGHGDIGPIIAACCALTAGLLSLSHSLPAVRRSARQREAIDHGRSPTDLN